MPNDNLEEDGRQQTAEDRQEAAEEAVSHQPSAVSEEEAAEAAEEAEVGVAAGAEDSHRSFISERNEQDESNVLPNMDNVTKPEEVEEAASTEEAVSHQPTADSEEAAEEAVSHQP
ncbi:MAG: hypothetical protein M3132_13815, partial [Actinomycetia bacterium]|nr:hypothetical protein [Actinomycetes bacterium]